VLKSLMKANGFPKVKLIGKFASLNSAEWPESVRFISLPFDFIGYEHNWSDATVYLVQHMKAAGGAFDGVSFHCYPGSVRQQGDFSKLYPNKVHLPSLYSPNP
jgi:hypothetical protein